MRRAFMIFVLAACGPSVPVDDAGDEAGVDQTGEPESTTGGGTTVGATSLTTLDTTMTTATTIDSGDVDDGDPTDDDATDGDTFITKPDVVCFTHCSLECDQFAQDCPDDEKCMPWANDGGDEWNANKCAPVERAPAAIGESCIVQGSGFSGLDDCDFGAMCFGVDPLTNEGVCVPTCTGSEDAPICPEGLACTRGFDGYLNVCLPICDPLAPSCAADEVCANTADYIVGGDFLCHPMPPFEPQPYGAPCFGLQACDAGLMCFPSEFLPGCVDESCCSLLGDVAAPPVCPDPMQECIPVFEGDPPEGLCVCGVPL
jgi:hypothetical protein